jgi:hypothetical protein
MFRVLSASFIRSTIKTADAVIGTVHVSVWFKSVKDVQYKALVAKCMEYSAVERYT